jgi:hypothetical protein
LLYKNNLYFPTYPGSKDSHDGAGDVAQVVEYLPRDVKPWVQTPVLPNKIKSNKGKDSHDV